MAEFKLGRIRFVWKGEWNATTVYYKDDVVKYGGKTYICQVGHTSDADFYTDLDFVPTKWNQMTDGQAWRDQWAEETFYKKGDIVSYGATIYICDVPHTSATEALGLEEDLGNWQIFVEGLDWKGDWETAFSYKLNDLVRYGGNVYVCNTAHTSQATTDAGLEEDIDNWDAFNEGIEFKGDWSNSSVRYKINDVVKYGAGLWICVTNHTSSSTIPTDTFESQEENWSQFVKGFEFEDEWLVGTTYQPGDIVSYGGNQYVAKTNHIGAVPSTSTVNWALFSEGLNYANDWNIATSYRIGDVVRVNGYTYVAVADSPAFSLTVTATAAATDRFTVSTNTTGLAANQAIRFTGTTFGNVFPTGTYYIRTVSSGLDFTITAVPGGSIFEAATATGSMTATISAHPSVSTGIWQNLTRGISWRGAWVDDREYDLGDTVRYGSNTYICVQKHRSEGDDGSSVTIQGGGQANSRPDIDVNGIYWDVLTIGSETSVLTTRGDLVYFNNNGPARLPVGIEGQILRVSEDLLPEWATLGSADFTYYVSTAGTDLPAPIHGRTWDKPFKTIRYACEQVEKGPRNPIAKRLLEMNRVFIQREVTEWIQWQIANAASGSIWENFVYEDFKCERDTGLIVDALMHDISHGGNVKVRGAALALVNGLQDSPGTYSLLAQEALNDSAAWNYMLDVIESVLNQEAPAVNYQDTNTDNSTSKVSQWFDATLAPVEDGAYTNVVSLVSIITNALADGDAENIPARYAPTNLIRIATGQYREVLPIIVPEQTCVIGAELRSTNAGPIGSIVDISDAKYSLGALGRLETIISDIVTGGNISETVGNTEVQSVSWPLADAAQGDDLKQLVRAMQYKIDYNLGLANFASLTDPTGYNTSYLTGYGDAKTLLRENKKFMQDEIISYIAVNYPSVKYSKTACRRDVGHVVDAMIYDLTYGGNTQSINAGLAYYDGPGSSYSINGAELTATIASYGRLKTVMQQLAANTTVTKSNGNPATQWKNTALTNGNLASTFIGNNIDIITNIIAGDSTEGNPPQVRVTSITTGNVANTAAAHDLGAGDTFTPEVTGNGFIEGTTYYVLTASGTQFTVSTSFGGSTHTLTNGTGLDIEGAVVNWPAATDGVTTTTALISAFTSLSAAVPTIKVDTIDYINSTYGDFIYDSSKCRRDTGIIVDGVYYDVALGTNYNAIVNGLSYRRAMAVNVIANQLDETAGALKHAKTLAAVSLASNSTAVSRSNAAFTEVVDIILNGESAADAITWSDPGVDANKRYAREQLQTNRTFIIDELISWIASNYPALTYDTDTCRRDTGYIIDAFSYDVQYGGNTATRTAAIAYFEGTVSILPTTEQKEATAAAITQLGVISAAVAQEIYAGQNTSGTAATSTEGTQITGLAAIINEVIDDDNLDGLDAASFPSITWAAAGIQTAVAQLAFDRTSIVAGTLQYISDTYNSFTYNHSKCSRDVGIILDAVGYDFMFNSNFQTWKSSLAYLRATASEVFILGQKAATRGALEFVKTQALASVGGNTTAQARITTLMQLVDDIIFAGSNQGSTCASENRLVDYAVHQLERNRDYIVAEVDAWIKNSYKSTVTNTTVTTDVITVDNPQTWLQRNAAIVFEGTTFGNIVAGTTYYVQSVLSSTTFKIATTRDSATALTLSTASGSCVVKIVYNEALCLRDLNEYVDALKYDIKYPGNYKALLAARYYSNAVRGSLEEDMYYLRDGTGVRDQTLAGLTGDLTSPNEFGTSRVTAGAYCSLDPGWGPDDFRTWIINRSPYIQGVTTFGYAAIGQKIDGALHNGGNDSMVSNDFTQVISDGIGAWVANNGRAELVSVFTYYSHIGYLTTEGGRIRGTNGNNSYGDFGSVAEGFDMTEVPNTAEVDNKFQFKSTVSEVNTNGSQILNFEFENSGIDYTEVDWTVTGGGNGADAVGNEFRDGAVHSVRLTDVADPDLNSDDAYDGQFGGSGYITNSNTAQGGTLSSITLAATDAELSTAYIGMKVVITAGAGVGQFGIVATYNNGTKSATVVKESDGTAGWDHVIPGTTIAIPDASTAYTVEPRISFSAPTYASSAGTAAAAAAYGDIEFVETFASYVDVTGSVSQSGTGAIFRVIRKGSKYSVFLTSGGIGFTRLETITIDGANLGGVSTTNDIVITVTSLNTVGTITGFDFEGTGAGGIYVAIRSDSTTEAITSSGGAWTSRTLPGSANTWSSIAAGRVTFTEAITAVVVGRAYRITTLGTANNFLTLGAPVNQVGVDFIATTTGFGDATVTPLITRLVAITTGSNATAYSDDGGVTWTAGGNLPTSGTWNKVAYGGGRWIAIKTGSTDTAVSDDGVNWLAGGALPSATTWTDITFGANKWVAVASGGVAAASSVNAGGTWLLRTLPTTNNWSSVTFGNNRFVAVSSTSGTVAAISLNGFDWTQTVITSAAYQSVTYGQGIFFAVGTGTTSASSEDGIVWTSRTISTSNSVAVAFGNVSRTPRFRTISSTGASNTSEITCGARARGRAYVAQGRIFKITIIEPGSTYTVAPTMTITDPNNIYEAPFTVRVGSGVLANPTFANRGSGYTTGSAEVFTGNGYADLFQSGSFIAVRRITQRPVPGSNVVFDSLPDQTFKLVTVVTFLGSQDGSYTAFFQVSPQIPVSQSPEHGDGVTTRIRYSQVRLTGHDFLDIGTGNFDETNYPGGEPENDPAPGNETVANNGGRVFYTSTDQDGNFRVGELFAIEQSTGIATLNADAFNISGLQELNLGNVTLGGGSATITEFSTDPFFTADSDNVVPTQRAIKAFIAAQIGGGGASLNVNSVTAGSIFINSNQITTTTGVGINVNATLEFRRGITGVPLALNYYFK